MTGRPTGITVVCVLFGLGGAVTLLTTLTRFDVIAGIRESGISIPFYFITNVMLPIASIVAAYGLWNRMPWAWRLGAALAALNLFVQLLMIGTWAIDKSIIYAAPMLWKLVIPLAVLAYLLRAPVIEAFGGSKESVTSRRVEVLGAGILMAGALFFYFTPLTNA